VSWRRRYDTRWAYNVTALTDHEDIVAFDAGVNRYFGPLQDRRTRPLRLSLSAGPAFLDPDFRPTEGDNVALGASLAAAWDTRVEDLLPTNGHNVTLATTAGFVPSSDERWTSLSLRALGLVPFAETRGRCRARRRRPRHGDVAHRLLTLGGTAATCRRSPPIACVGDRRWVARSSSAGTRSATHRSRWASTGARTSSSPRDSTGVCSGPTGSIQRPHGWTGGVFAVGDILGAQPARIGVLVAGPLAWAPDDLVEDGRSQIYAPVSIRRSERRYFGCCAFKPASSRSCCPSRE
jgi:hypothetical protein